MSAFLERRWSRLTPAQRAYLVAVAELGDTPRTAAVAARLGRRPESATAVRDTLISDGVLFAPERGRIAFAIPPLAQHALRAAGTP